MPDTTTLPAPAKAAQTGGRRGRGAPAMKFLGSLRGQGLLLSTAGEAPVAYQLDVFEGGAGRSGSGSVDGAMPPASDEGTAEARLRLSDGRELAISLQSMDEGGALFESRGAVPLPN